MKDEKDLFYFFDMFEGEIDVGNCLVFVVNFSLEVDFV